jgi:hypothetical protein
MRGKPFEEGNPGKKPGTKNKLSALTREFIHDIITDNREAFTESLLQLKEKKPYEFCKIFMELVSYDTPKLRAIEVEMDEVSLLTEEQRKSIYKNVAMQALFAIHGDKIPDSIKKKYDRL